MSDDLEPLDPLHEASFLEGQRAIAKGLSDRRLEEQLESLGQVGKKAAETITQAKELASDQDPDKEQLAALITNGVLGAVRQMTTGRPPAEEARGAAQASPLSNGSTSSIRPLPGSTPAALPEPAAMSPKELEHRPSEPPKRKRGRPPKNAKG